MLLRLEYSYNIRGIVYSFKLGRKKTKQNKTKKTKKTKKNALATRKVSIFDHFSRGLSQSSPERSIRDYHNDRWRGFDLKLEHEVEATQSSQYSKWRQVPRRAKHKTFPFSEDYINI